jgi:hypothetical protein
MSKAVTGLVIPQGLVIDLAKLGRQQVLPPAWAGGAEILGAPAARPGQGLLPVGHIAI